jgi:YD repeat-containing protein
MKLHHLYVAGLLSFLIFPLESTAQSKKEIRNNNIASETTYITVFENGKQLKYKDSYVSYNDSGDKTEEVEYGKDGKAKNRKIYKYSAEGKLAEESEYSSKSGKTKVYKYTYDENGNKLTETEYNSSGKMVQKYVYTYDEKGFKSESGKPTMPQIILWQ